MGRNFKVEKLQAGETIISKEPGNSMLPLIKSKQPVKSLMKNKLLLSRTTLLLYLKK